jgi:hypothetical protein
MIWKDKKRSGNARQDNIKVNMQVQVQVQIVWDEMTCNYVWYLLLACPARRPGGKPSRPLTNDPSRKSAICSNINVLYYVI